MKKSIESLSYNGTQKSFYTPFVKASRKGEENSGELKVETAGYIPAKMQIENILDAGRRLENYRKENYDFQPGEQEYDFPIPDRTPNFDMADASQIASETEFRLQTQENKEKDRKKKEKEEKDLKNKENAENAEKYKKSLLKEE